jgi:hypothetical protein
MLIWTILATIFLAGAIGGVINALMTDNGFVLPKFEKTNGILRPGLLGNVLIGAVASIVSWGLYGPLTNYAIIAPQTAADAAAATTGPSLTLATFVGAILIGIAGSKWLSNEVDKKLVKAAAATAAAAGASPGASAQIMAATPAKALEIAQAL